jgi:small nuclear ribonucleoprotein (snRNP)-like protein
MDSVIEQLIGKEVVLDMGSRYVFLGTLSAEDQHYLVLENVDVHDLRDTTSTREYYVLESKIHGVRANRRRVLVSRADIIGISALADVID